MNELAAEKIMTIKELAELWEISYKPIRQAIKKLFPNKLQNGITTYLNEKECALIKEKIVENKRIDLDFKEKVVSESDDDLIIIRGLEAAQRKILKLRQEKELLHNKIEADKSKIEFYDTVAKSDKWIDMAEAAKIINNAGIGRNKLFSILRANNIFRANNEPYQEYVDRGYFKLVETKKIVEDEVKIFIKTVVSQKGLDFIINKLKISI